MLLEQTGHVVGCLSATDGRGSGRHVGEDIAVADETVELGDEPVAVQLGVRNMASPAARTLMRATVRPLSR